MVIEFVLATGIPLLTVVDGVGVCVGVGVLDCDKVNVGVLVNVGVFVGVLV